jgi:large subunit ribosomal protein L21
MGEGAEIKVGTPVIEGAKVEAEIIDQFRGPKLIAFKMKRRKGYRKRKGHRQELTKVRILSIA